MSRDWKKTVFATAFGLLLAGFVATSAWARTIPVNIEKDGYNPSEVKAFSGDRLEICNQTNYRRQPYTSNRYNRFGRRTADTFEMLRKGECKEVTLKNSTGNVLKFTIRDAIANKAKLKVTVLRTKVSK